MKRGVEIFDLFFVLRPTLFYPIWTFFLAGLYGGMHSEMGGLHLRLSHPLWTIAGLTMVMGTVFILNQIEDKETDRANGKLFLIANGIVTLRAAYIEAMLLGVAGSILGFVNHRFIGLGFVLLLLLSGWLYNYPPSVWKNHPVMGMVTNGTGGLIIYCLGWNTGGGEGIPLRVAAYTLAGASVFLNTTLPDLNGDRETGKITFGVRYGVGPTAVLALVLEFIVVLLSLYLRDWFLFIPAIAVLPLFIYGAWKRTVADVVRATKYSVLALAASVCIVFPLYLIPVFFVFFFSRWYYRKRFNFDYPSFKTG